VIVVVVVVISECGFYGLWVVCIGAVLLV